jgi:hypothetical protein
MLLERIGEMDVFSLRRGSRNQQYVASFWFNSSHRRADVGRAETEPATTALTVEFELVALYGHRSSGYQKQGRERSNSISHSYLTRPLYDRKVLATVYCCCCCSELLSFLFLRLPSLTPIATSDGEQAHGQLSLFSNISFPPFELLMRFRTTVTS